MSKRTTGKRITYDQMDLATRMAEREWKHSQKSPNIPMSVKAEIRAELDRLERQVRKLCIKGPDYELSPEYSEVNISEVLDLIKQAKQ